MLKENAVYTISNAQAFRMGFLSNFLNPKVSLFFLSIFPQFTSTDQLHNPFLLIGCFLSATAHGTLVHCCLSA
ncbi:LysE family transporter [Terribacillus saccharophilus]|jgi:threonine/homoserine/homoserine lactone efflux protein|uniref:LysE family transporter n=1 Tax=Terribacillus saccharophilus TaxID=361277 RepID=UPI00114013B7